LLINGTIAQDFCGVIKYRYTYYRGKCKKDVTAKVKDSKTEEFHICGNKFKTYFDGKLTEILIGDSASYFFVLSDSIIGYTRADSAYGQFPPKYKSVKETVYKNKEYKYLEETSNNETVTYYFNDDVRIDPYQFRKIRLYHWDKFFAATNGALRLVGISKSRKSLRVSEAVDIIRMPPENMDFTIPSCYKIEVREKFRVYN
jgi:hypothetical protein